MTAKLLVVLVLALFVAGGVAFTVVRPWEGKLGPSATARQLQDRLRTDVRYSCEDAHAVQSTLANADYLCKPTGNGQLQGYWVATNHSRITDIQPTG